MRTIWRAASLLALVAAVSLAQGDEPEKSTKPQVIRKATLRLVVPATKPAAKAAGKAATETVVEVTLEEEPTIKPGAEVSASHEQVAAIEVKGEQGSKLQTLSATPDGKIVGLVAPARNSPIGVAGASAAKNEVRLFDSEGKETARWDLAFTGQSIGVGPDGTIYAAGDGRLAKFSPDGRLLTEVEVPHLAEVLKNQDALKEKAEQQLKQEQQSFVSSKSAYEQIVKQLEDKTERTATEEQQLKAYKTYLETFDQRAAAYKGRKRCTRPSQWRRCR